MHETAPPTQMSPDNTTSRASRQAWAAPFYRLNIYIFLVLFP